MLLLPFQCNKLYTISALWWISKKFCRFWQAAPLKVGQICKPDRPQNSIWRQKQLSCANFFASYERLIVQPNTFFILAAAHYSYFVLCLLFRILIQSRHKDNKVFYQFFSHETFYLNLFHTYCRMIIRNG